MSWNDKEYNAIVAKHPALDDKPESVALAVWALTQNRKMSPQDWRDLSEKTGVRVAGRAVGSARAVLGLPSGKPSKTSKGRAAKRTAPGRNGRGLDGLQAVIQGVKEQQRESAELRAALEKIRAIVADVI